METENKCTVVITGTFKEGGSGTPEFKEYSRKANAIVEEKGGVVVAKHMVEQNLGDGETPHLVVTVEFPSKEKAVEAFSNEEYTSIIPLRQAATSEVNILITK